VSRILHIYKDYYPVLGGMENHIKVIAEAQAAAGHDVTVLVNSLNARTHEEVVNGVRVIKAGRLCTVASTPLSLAMPLQRRRLHPDLVHLHFPYPWGEISNLLFGRRTKTVVSYQSDVVRQRTLLKLYRPLLWKTLLAADRIITHNPRYIESSPFLHRLADRCTVIPLGVDMARFENPDPGVVDMLRRRYPGPRLLFVGRLRYYKGVGYLIQAMPMISAQLLIVGDGPMRREWEQQAGDLGVRERVHFLDEVDDADLPAYYHACDLFVLPSCHRSEAFGTVLLEAMACARALISTELGTGTSWVNQHEETGLVVPPADPQALAAAANALLSDDSLRQRYGRAARARAEAEFRQELMIQRIEALYRELLA